MKVQALRNRTVQDSTSIRGQYSRVQHSVVTLECNARVEDCNINFGKKRDDGK